MVLAADPVVPALGRGYRSLITQIVEPTQAAGWAALYDGWADWVGGGGTGGGAGGGARMAGRRGRGQIFCLVGLRTGNLCETTGCTGMRSTGIPNDRLTTANETRYLTDWIKGAGRCCLLLIDESAALIRKEPGVMHDLTLHIRFNKPAEAAAASSQVPSTRHAPTPPIALARSLIFNPPRQLRVVLTDVRAPSDFAPLTGQHPAAAAALVPPRPTPSLAFRRWPGRSSPRR
jgi:hypothetical protein